MCMVVLMNQQSTMLHIILYFQAQKDCRHSTFHWLIEYIDNSLLFVSSLP
jgi:hypothetical protein